jgi:dihydrofolate reductase
VPTSWGSSKLVLLLFKNDPVDELKLKIFPLALGNTKTLMDTGTIPASFKLIDSTDTSLGVIIANYQRAGEVKTGTAAA